MKWLLVLLASLGGVVLRSYHLVLIDGGFADLEVPILWSEAAHQGSGVLVVG